MPDYSGATVVTPHAVLLSGNPIYPQQALANAAITPGHLVEQMTTGNLRVHATAVGNALPAFADVNVTPDRTVSTQANALAYSAGETVKWMIGRPGDIVYAWLPTSATAVAIGDFLTSNGDGALRKLVSATQAVNEAGTATYTVTQLTNNIVAQAAEAVDNSANTTTAVRIRVRVV